jgi:hypothetical protein
MAGLNKTERFFNTQTQPTILFPTKSKFFKNYQITFTSRRGIEGQTSTIDKEHYLVNSGGLTPFPMTPFPKDATPMTHAPMTHQ